MTLTLLALAVGGLFCGAVVGVVAVVALSVRREDAQPRLGPPLPLSSAPTGSLSRAVRGILGLHIRREGHPREVTGGHARRREGYGRVTRPEPVVGAVAEPAGSLVGSGR